MEERNKSEKKTGIDILIILTNSTTKQYQCMHTSNVSIIITNIKTLEKCDRNCEYGG